jgi:hypothetical protein
VDRWLVACLILDASLGDLGLLLVGWGVTFVVVRLGVLASCAAFRERTWFWVRPGCACVCVGVVGL